MFFSAKELYAYFTETPNRIPHWWEDEYGFKFNKTNCAKYLAAVKRGIVERQGDVTIGDGYEDLYKWIRPWDVVPKLRDFAPPVGDYGIGVEVEYGFNSLEDAQFIANKVKNWRYIALDIEGGDDPIEATFPPVLYSKLNSKSQVFRYTKLLRENQERVHEHDPEHFVGTHINVSKGGVVSFHPERREQMYYVLLAARGITPVQEYMTWNVNGFGDNPLTQEECEKYFNRIPYGGVYTQQKYLEFKMFNSTTDSKAIRRYVNIAVSLTDLLTSDTPITHQSVREACELGYNKR